MGVNEDLCIVLGEGAVKACSPVILLMWGPKGKCTVQDDTETFDLAEDGNRRAGGFWRVWTLNQ